MKRWCAYLLMVMLGLAFGCAKKTEAPPGEGKQAVDFTLKSLDGQEVKLSSLRGKVVVLNFWATWCPPCRDEIPSMVRLNKQMAGKPYQMLAVSIDEGGKKAVEDFFTKAGVSLPVLLDPERQVANRYGITGVPETFVIDRSGVIVKKVVGAMGWDDPQVIASLEKMMQ